MTSALIERPVRRRDKHSDQYRMSLLDGYTCGNCRCFQACAALFGCNAANEACDWAPSKFYPKAQETTG